jgi:hypothetical protein
MNMDDYPHFLLTEDGRLCSMGYHCPGFLRVLYDALLYLGYIGDALIYHCQLFMAHGLDVYEVRLFDPTEPWSGSVIGSEPDTIIEMMAHVALTYLSESYLTATATLPIALLLIQNQDPIWQQCLVAMSNLERPHFHVRMTSLAKYEQYTFNLQQNTARTGMHQRICLTAYEEHATATSCELERLRHENVVLHSSTLPPLEQDRELKVAYR